MAAPLFSVFTDNNQPCFHGTRTPIDVLFVNLAAGERLDVILENPLRPWCQDRLGARCVQTPSYESGPIQTTSVARATMMPQLGWAGQAAAAGRLHDPR